MTKKKEERTKMDPKDMNCKQLFTAKMPNYSFPMTQKEAIAKLEQVKPDHTETYKAYFSWAKRKKNPFPFRLVQKGDKYELVEKEPDKNV